MLGAGTVLDGRFQIQEIIGRGGMGAVYRAQDKNSGRIVAIKELLVHLENPYEKESAIKQFEREAKMLVRLSHPGIPEQLGYFLSGEGAYLAMEFIEGTTLESIVCENEELPSERTVIEWGIQLCDVLEYLHELTPIIFRDLKPSNVMLTGNQIKLVDFGIAKRLDPIMQTASVLKGSGTPGYAPMEQYGKGSTDPRSDVYSLGATMYFLLTGRDPPQSVDIASGVDVLVPPRAYNPEISEAMEATIMRMMALKKEDRYQSASDAAEVLEACKSSIGLTVIRIPSRGKGQPLESQQNTQAVGIAGGGLTATEPLPETPRQPSIKKLPPPPPRLQPPPRRVPWKVVGVAGGVAAAGALFFWLVNPLAPSMHVRVVVDSNQEADMVQKELSSGLTWTRSAVPRVSEVPDGYTLEVSAGSPAQAQTLVRLAGVPATVITRADGTPGMRVSESWSTLHDATVHQKNVAHKLHRPVDLVKRTRRRTTTVLVLETTVRGQDRAEALKRELEEHQVDALITEQ